MSNQIITTLIDGGNIIGKVSGFTYSRVQTGIEALGARLDASDAQLAETDQRIDNLVTTPVPTGEIIAEEIIDARQGEMSLGANITEVKSQLGQTTNGIKPSQSVWKEFEQRSINVKWFGAKGNGYSDDSQAIQDALDFANTLFGGFVFIPQGTYMVSETLVVYSNTNVIGSGIGVTTIKAFPNTYFPIYIPYEWEGQTERTKYRTLIRTAEDSQNISFKNITIDYSNCPTSHQSSAPLMIVDTVNNVVSEVEIKNIIEDGWEDRLDSEYGDRNSGCAILYAFAKDSICEKSVFYSSEYEPISIRYQSKNIFIQNNTVHAENTNSHAIQTARPTVSGLGYIENVTISNNVFYIKNSQDAIGLHGTRDVNIEGNVVILLTGNNKRARAMIRMVDAVENINIKDNILDMREWGHAQPLSAVLLDEGRTHSNGSKRGINVINNLIKCKFIEGLYDSDVGIRQRPVIGATLGANINQINIIGNQIDYYGFPAQKMPTIALNAQEFSIKDNKIMIVEDSFNVSGNDCPEAIVITAGRRGHITGNTLSAISTVTGRFLNGVVIESAVHDSIISGNMFVHRVANSPFVNRSQNTIIFSDNIGAVANE